MSPVELFGRDQGGERGNDAIEAAQLGGAFGTARRMRGHALGDLFSRNAERYGFDLVSCLLVRKLGRHGAPSAPAAPGASPSASRSFRIATRSRVRAVSG